MTYGDSLSNNSGELHTALVGTIQRSAFTEEGDFATFATVSGTFENPGGTTLFLLNDGVLQEVAREGREVGDTGIIPSAIVPFGTLGISSNNEVAFAIGGRFRSTGFLLLNENADLIDELTVPFFFTADDGDFYEFNNQGTAFFSLNEGDNSYQFRQGGEPIELFRNNEPVPNGDGLFGFLSGLFSGESNIINETLYRFADIKLE